MKMRTFISITAVILTGLFFQGCSDATVSEPNREAVLKIEGMTCQMGCANTIQTRLQKMQGVASAEVDFEKETATVKFDNKTTSEKEIKATVNTLAAGAYKVVEYTEREISSSSSAATNTSSKTEKGFSTESAPMFDLGSILEKLIFFVR